MLLVLLLPAAALQAQEAPDDLEEAVSSYIEKNYDQLTWDEESTLFPETGTDVPEIRRMDSEAWKAATEGLDYKEASPPASFTAEEQPAGETPVWVSYVVYGFLIALALVLVYLAIRKWGQRMPIPEQAAEAPSPESVEELQDWDLERLAEQARARGDWAEALRWHFLSVLQGLSERGWIEWTRDKTNRHYQRELRRNAGQEWGRAFRAVAQAFERYRYGGVPLDRQGFEAVLPQIRSLNEQARRRT